MPLLKCRKGLKRALLLLLLAVAVLAQTASQIESDDVKRVGTKLTCQCGACKDNLNCMMSAGQCHFCKPARTKIFKMQSAGLNDTQVIDSFIREYGPAIFRPDPNNSFWIVPYALLGFGVVGIFFILKKMMKKPGGPLTPALAGNLPVLVDDPALAKYRDTIEKDLAKLE